MKSKLVMAPLLAACLAAGLSVGPQATSARADVVEDDVSGLATNIEEISDALLVDGVSSLSLKSGTANQSPGLAYYISTLEAEAESIRALGGVTVLDTTAEIIKDVSSKNTAKPQAYLHVTRTVAELPSGELWEEMIPITLTTAPDGTISVTDVDIPMVPLMNESQAKASRTLLPSEPGAASIDLSGPASPSVNKFNPTASITYAKKWWNGRNSAYPTNYPNDCTNIVSQAMKEGGWTTVSGWYKSDKAWWYGWPTSAYPWGGAENFYRFAVKESKRATPLYYVKDLWLGDVLQYKKKGATNISHTMIVTNWVNNVPYLTYHTNDTLNKPFTAISSLNVTWFASDVK